MPYSYSQGCYLHNFDDLPDFEVERNLLSFATSRSGKGATQIIPWLLENIDTNALVIDPKGEALEATIAKRIRHKTVAVLDPFKTTKVPETYHAKINILDFIDVSKNSAFREINALSDGLVHHDNKEAAHWNSGGVEVLAGFIAHVLTAPEFEGQRHLPKVRELITQPREIFDATVEKMENNHACGKLPATASSKLTNTGNEANHFISVAASNTKWLDDPDIKECLSTSTFDLKKIKIKPLDVFLVLPVEALGDYARFLKMFVRMALYHMMIKTSQGKLKSRDVFFILDEFFSLGFISEIQSSMSSMPGFGLHIWPFLQDINQLKEVYGSNGTGTFFANSDASYFYGINDPETAEYVSREVGQITENDLQVKPPFKPKNLVDKASGWDRFWGNETEEQKIKRLATERPAPSNDWQFIHNEHQWAVAELDAMTRNQEANYTDAMNEYHHARSSVGKRRITPEQVRQITKRDNAKPKISRTALVIREGGTTYKQSLRGWFETSG